MAALCERPRIDTQTKIVETRGPEALRLRIAAALNGVLEARQLRGGEIVVGRAKQHLDNLILSPGGLEALQSLSKKS